MAEFVEALMPAAQAESSGSECQRDLEAVEEADVRSRLLEARLPSGTAAKSPLIGRDRSFSSRAVVSFGSVRRTSGVRAFPQPFHLLRRQLPPPAWLQN